MKLLMKIVLNVFLSISFILLSVQIISTKPYMMVSENKYESHKYITWDYEYAVTNIMDYLNGKQDTLEFSSFPGGDDVLMTERGLPHMEDVRVLYDNGRTLMALSFVMIVISGIYLFDRKELWKTLTKVWIFPTVIVGSITLLMIIDFSWAFTMFHEILFSNDLWILRSDDPLIVMLPLNFFFVTAITIVSFIVLFHTLAFLFARRKAQN
ncbi:TIGR01906 family membrane protein [Mycoplasmatota bacterium WC44]